MSLGWRIDWAPEGWLYPGGECAVVYHPRRDIAIVCLRSKARRVWWRATLLGH